MAADKSPSNSTVALLKQTFKEFSEDECPRMAAALSYYTVFSLPPLLVLILLLLGIFMSPGDVQGTFEQQLQGLMGPAGGEQVRTIIEQAERPDAGRPLAAILSIGALLFGATGAFVELQTALNRAWDVKPDPEKGGIMTVIGKRVLSLGMVLVIAFLLVVSLVVSAVLAAFGGALAGMLPEAFSGVLLQVIDIALSLLVFGLLFGAMFKVLPDAQIAWKDVWVGALFTAVLFVVGKLLIGLYLGQSNPGEAFGAAGSLAVLLVWIYYSAMILFFGAEFTQNWAESRGHGVRPNEDAVRVVREEYRLGADGQRHQVSD
jgi:membrane protein